MCLVLYTGYRCKVGIRAMFACAFLQRSEVPLARNCVRYHICRVSHTSTTVRVEVRTIFALYFEKAVDMLKLKSSPRNHLCGA